MFYLPNLKTYDVKPVGINERCDLEQVIVKIDGWFVIKSIEVFN